MQSSCTSKTALRMASRVAVLSLLFVGGCGGPAERGSPEYDNGGIWDPWMAFGLFSVEPYQVKQGDDLEVPKPPAYGFVSTETYGERRRAGPFVWWYSDSAVIYMMGWWDASLGRPSRCTVYERDGSVKCQWTVVTLHPPLSYTNSGDPVSSLPASARSVERPPWLWGVSNQIGPTAPWLSIGFGEGAARAWYEMSLEKSTRVD